MDKQSLRSLYRQKRQQYFAVDPKPTEDIQNYIDVLLENLNGSVGIYAAFDGEVDLFPYFQNSKQELCFPKVCGEKIDFFKSAIKDLKPGSFGILEPNDSSHLQVESKDISAIFVPGIAFDRSGGRLGFGRGYYDRFLKDFQGIKIGVCHSFQWSDIPLPMEEHDVYMNFIISEGCLVQPVRQ